MSMPGQRSGIPHVRRITFDTTGRKHFIKGVTNWVRLRVTGNPAIVYFTEDDFTNATTNYILIPIPAADAPYGEWWGPIEVDSFWIKGSGGSTNVEIVAVKRLN